MCRGTHVKVIMHIVISLISKQSMVHTQKITNRITENYKWHYACNYRMYCTQLELCKATFFQNTIYHNKKSQIPEYPLTYVDNYLMLNGQ